MRRFTYQLTTDFTSTCPQTEVKDYLASLEVMCGQHVESSVRC